jgi:hypothetical protein
VETGFTGLDPPPSHQWLNGISGFYSDKLLRVIPTNRLGLFARRRF